jgi:DNA invertase Pin-like site-specific DNA recombinase
MTLDMQAAASRVGRVFARLEGAPADREPSPAPRPRRTRSRVAPPKAPTQPDGRHREAGVRVGYARTSTLDQVAGFEAQVRELEAAGCTRVYKEQVSSVAAARPELEAMLDWVRGGDEVVVTKVDRLARSVADLLNIIERIRSKGAAIYIGNLGRINGDPTGMLLLNVLGAIAQFERQMMLERQREGIAKAKAEGRYKGRKPTAMAKAGQVREMVTAGVSKAEIARRLGIAESSVYRILAS